MLKTANKLYQQTSLDVFKDKKALRIYLLQLIRRMLIDMYHLSINKFPVIDLRKKIIVSIKKVFSTQNLNMFLVFKSKHNTIF